MATLKMGQRERKLKTFELIKRLEDGNPENGKKEVENGFVFRLVFVGK